MDFHLTDAEIGALVKRLPKDTYVVHSEEFQWEVGRTPPPFENWEIVPARTLEDALIAAEKLGWLNEQNAD